MFNYAIENSLEFLHEWYVLYKNIRFECFVWKFYDNKCNGGRFDYRDLITVYDTEDVVVETAEITININ